MTHQLTTDGVLVTSEQVRNAGFERVAGRPVELKALVTYYSPDWPILFLDDGVSGCYVETVSKHSIQSGDEVEIRARTGDLGQVAQPTFRILRRDQPFPAGRSAAYVKLSSGRLDSQWVAIEAQLTSFRLERGHLILSLEVSADEVFLAMLPEGAMSLTVAREWLGARLRVEGVCGGIHDASGKWIGFRIWVPSSRLMTVVQRPLADPFEQPRIPISRLFTFQPDTLEARQGHFAGVVTLVRSTNAFYLQDSSGGTYVRCKESMNLKVGESWRVAAKPRMGAFAPFLDEARLRPVEGAPVSSPLISKINASALMDGQKEAELVLTSGLLLKQTIAGADHEFILQAGETVFVATLPGSNVTVPLRQPGTLLAFTGVCSVESDPHRGARAIRVLCRGPEDIVVLQSLPLLTWPRVLALLAGAAIVFLGVTTMLLRYKSRLKERYRQLVHTVSDIVFELDSSGCVTSWNPAGSQVTGYAAEEILGCPLFTVLRSPDPALTPGKLLSNLGPANAAVFQTEVWTKAGNMRTLEVALALRQDAGSARFGGVARDITGRVQAEQARIRMERRSQESERLESLGVLAGGLAHDFNNLLTVIIVNTTLIQEEMPENSGVQENVRNIHHAARRAASLCSQMLAYAGAGHYVEREIDVPRLVEETLSPTKPLHPPSAALQIHIDRGLPPVRGDADQLRQLIVSLVLNAGESLKDQSGLIRVAVYLRRCSGQDLADVTSVGARIAEPTEGDYVCFEVVDTGCGMTPDVLKRIFEPFFSTKFAGRGLGLSAALGIVRCHRGFIEVQSEPAKGSTFQVLLPAISPMPAKTRSGT